MLKKIALFISGLFSIVGAIAFGQWRERNRMHAISDIAFSRLKNAIASPARSLSLEELSTSPEFLDFVQVAYGNDRIVVMTLMTIFRQSKNDPQQRQPAKHFLEMLAKEERRQGTVSKEKESPLLRLVS